MKYLTLAVALLAALPASAGDRKPNPFAPAVTAVVVVAADAVWTGEFWRIELRWVDDHGDLHQEEEVPADDLAFEPRAQPAELWTAAKGAATLNGLPTPRRFRVIRRGRS